MTQSKSQILTTVLSNVLEEMAFLDVEVPEETPHRDETAVAVNIHFSGPQKGTLSLWTDTGFADMLAANLLGIEEHEPDAHLSAQDAVKELMNVLCGHVVSELFGCESSVELTIPELVEECDNSPDPPSAEIASCRVEVEGHPVELTLCTFEIVTLK